MLMLLDKNHILHELLMCEARRYDFCPCDIMGRKQLEGCDFYPCDFGWRYLASTYFDLPLNVKSPIKAVECYSIVDIEPYIDEGEKWQAKNPDQRIFLSIAYTVPQYVAFMERLRITSSRFYPQACLDVIVRKPERVPLADYSKIVKPMRSSPFSYKRGIVSCL